MDALPVTKLALHWQQTGRNHQSFPQMSDTSHVTRLADRSLGFDHFRCFNLCCCLFSIPKADQQHLSKWTCIHCIFSSSICSSNLCTCDASGSHFESTIFFKYIPKRTAGVRDQTASPLLNGQLLNILSRGHPLIVWKYRLFLSALLDRCFSSIFNQE